MEDFWGLGHHANSVGSGWVGAAIPSGRLIDRILAQMYYSTYVRVKRKAGLLGANVWIERVFCYIGRLMSNKTCLALFNESS